MQPTPPPLDIVTAAIALAGLVFAPAVAHAVGPYAVILLGAILGAAISAGLRPPDSRIGGATHMLIWVGLTVVLTVPASMVAVNYMPHVEVRWLLGPMAILIAGIGHQWPDVVRWGLSLAKRFAERFIEKRGAE
jgi:hypothetical protein